MRRLLPAGAAKAGIHQGWQRLDHLWALCASVIKSYQAGRRAKPPLASAHAQQPQCSEHQQAAVYAQQQQQISALGLRAAGVEPVQTLRRPKRRRNFDRL